MPPLRLSVLIDRTLPRRAAAHRSMARAALTADSSAAVRLQRYNSHMTKARALEASVDDLEARS
ncbi:hypothetical protein [Chromohalobacter japonicus]|uniref:hypothetical protein n=1 Tax=Chromohalobacter japonicus TaxID=223900 RepID=UPI001FF1D15C|nr:hypothetical protein [Chromohalobacter japonicus]MCK0751739.1 hypothetical protein [Chromohalobacter japonicus]